MPVRIDCDTTELIIKNKKLFTINIYDTVEVWWPPYSSTLTEIGFHLVDFDPFIFSKFYLFFFYISKDNND